MSPDPPPDGVRPAGCICKLFDSETVIVDPACTAQEHGVSLAFIRAMCDMQRVKVPYKPLVGWKDGFRLWHESRLEEIGYPADLVAELRDKRERWLATQQDRLSMDV